MNFKRLLSFVTAFNLTFSATCISSTGKVQSAETQKSGLVYGDLNDDGKISVLDFILFKAYLNDKNTKINMKAADLDGNEDVSVRDAIELSLYLSNYTGTFTNEMKLDTDGDGLSDYTEKEITHSDYMKPDTDGDTLNDYVEVYLCGTDPLHPSSNGSNIKDIDLDADGDGLTNGDEIKLGTSPDIIDTDEDGLTDYEEVKGKIKSDPLKPDSDDDGISDYGELKLSLNPMLAKTDGKTNDFDRYFIQTISGESLSDINTEDNFYKLSVAANMRGYAPETMMVTESSYSALLEEYAVTGKVVDVIYPENYKDESGNFSLNLRFELKNCSNPEDYMIFKYLKDDYVLLPIDTEWDKNTLCVNDTDAGTYCVVNLNAVNLNVFLETTDNTASGIDGTAQAINYSPDFSSYSNDASDSFSVYAENNAMASKSKSYTCVFNLGSNFKVGYWEAGVRSAVEESFRKLSENQYTPSVKMIFKGSYGTGNYVVTMTCSSMDDVTKLCNEASSFFRKNININNAEKEYLIANNNLGGKLSLSLSKLNYSAYTSEVIPTFVFNEDVSDAVCKFKSGGAVCSLLRKTTSNSKVINSVSASGAQKIYDIVTEAEGKTVYTSSILGKMLLKTTLTADMIKKYLSDKQMTAAQRKSIGFFDSDDDGIDDALEIAIELLKVNGDKIVFPSFGDAAKKNSAVSKGIDKFSKKKNVSSENVKSIQYLPQKQAVNNPDSDGDGLLDGKPIYLNDNSKIIVAPKDQEPTVYNGPKNMWRKHIETVKQGDIPTTLDGWYGYTGKKDPANIGIEGFEILKDEIDLLPEDVINNTKFKGYMTSAMVLAAIKPESASDSFMLAMNELKSIVDTETFKRIAAELGSAFLNFKKDRKDILHSQYLQWQSIGGYNNAYDRLFSIFTNDNMDKFKLPFSSENDEYILWGWRGDYLNLGAGAEVGIYQRPKFMHQNENKADHYFVNLAASMPMSLYLYDYYGENNIQNNYSWEPTVKQWWVCGWNPKDAWNVDVNQLEIVCKVDMSGHEELFRYFNSEYSNPFSNMRNYSKYLIVDEDNRTVWIMWGNK